MSSKNRILIVDDDESLRRVMEYQLTQAGYQVGTAAEGEQALAELGKQAQDLVITGLQMPGMSGLDLLRRIRAEYPEIPVILVIAYGTAETAVEAMKSGAFDYLTEPVNADELRILVNRALEHHRLIEEVQVLRTSLDQKYGFENIIGQSKSLLYVLASAARAAQSDATVLIRGETGTGKELLAKTIHFNSPRRNKPFITISCGAIPKELLESELFGHVRGSFAGATAHKKGRVEMADGGTLFLDEIGELPLELQGKLLRVIEEREIEKVGGVEPIKVDVRIVAATHRNLQRMAEDETFREDLYYRLAVIPLRLPPLRERLDDVPHLLQHLFLKAKQKQGRPNLRFPQALLPYFCSYRWPGNVRELENVLERIVVLARGKDIAVKDLPEQLTRERPALDIMQIDLPAQSVSLERLEKELILRALEKFSWNQTRAAAYLDLSRKTLIYRMKKFDLCHRTPTTHKREEAGSGHVRTSAAKEASR